MLFHVPEANHGLLENVLDHFRVPLKNSAITGIDETSFDRWIIRQYKRRTGISRLLTCRPDAPTEHSKDIRSLVSVDDMLGMVICQACTSIVKPPPPHESPVQL
ncbi:hypothetical protein [Pseudomonas khavaziana]|uniref:hypothetical protein n=1 Tax=Pseudomonas khavaziana TaxID=2842351 RepID=UPI001C3D04E6|nr:hypothetical protein [Pseudomonas khavaziana]MBV4478607.1 hypothetical protein [Pseudomonas khavaziana]